MRVAPIAAFVGANGSGKTLSAIAWAHAGHKLGQKVGKPRRVLTNVPGTSFDYFRTLADLSGDGLQDTDIVFDEAGVIFSSRNSSRDEEFLTVVQQLRKANARLFWTAPAYARADKVLREVTQVVVKCRGIGNVQRRGEVWPQPRFVVNAAFDANDFDTMGQRVSQNARRMGVKVWRVSAVGPLFDTLGRVGAGAEVGAGATADVHALTGTRGGSGRHAFPRPTPDDAPALASLHK